MKSAFAAALRLLGARAVGTPAIDETIISGGAFEKV